MPVKETKINSMDSGLFWETLSSVFKPFLGVKMTP